VVDEGFVVCDGQASDGWERLAIASKQVHRALGQKTENLISIITGLTDLNGPAARSVNDDAS
jgi:hypothetical protein